MKAGSFLKEVSPTTQSINITLLVCPTCLGHFLWKGRGLWEVMLFSLIPVFTPVSMRISFLTAVLQMSSYEIFQTCNLQSNQEDLRITF